MNPRTGLTKKRLLAITAIFLTTIFWGLSYISTKKLLNSLTPIQVAGGRFLLASVVSVAAALVSGHLAKVERADWPRMFGAAFLGIALYFVFENSGLKLTTAGMGSLIIATIPVINAIVARVFKAHHLQKFLAGSIIINGRGLSGNPRRVRFFIRFLRG